MNFNDDEQTEDKDGEKISFDAGTPDDVEDTEDGGAIIRMGEEDDNPTKQKHFENIVESIPQDVLSEVSSELLDKIEKDKEAREKRDKLYEEGIRRTGLGDDAPGGAQFSGANKVVHPMLVEACIDFSARVMKEIMPPNGPVKSKILGEQEREKVEKADRKAEFMNWQLTQQMREFRGEIEQMTTQIPLGGVQYLKLIYNQQRRRAMSEFIAVDDVYLPFAATNFYSAERKTHVQYLTKFEYNRRIKAGMYIDVDVGVPQEIEYSKAAIANNKVEGRTETTYNEDGLRTVFEVSTFLDLEEDGEAPYIISIDKSSGKVLSVYRNWEEDDESREELEWIVEFPFIPWRGAYPIGLTHIIGGLAGSATGALRALLDSAHIQNVPTMMKLKGGPGGQTINIQPTEVVEMDGGAMVDDIRKLAMPIPFNGPSPVLFQLLGFVVDAGKGVVQTSFEKLSDQNANQPVGTTMALIEQGMVVFSSIHARLHNSMERVFKILHRINSAYLEEEDIKRWVPDLDITPADFDGPMDVVPVSDPSIFSEAQRFAQTQAILQRAQALPQLYDVRKVEEMFLRNMKLSTDDVLQPAPGTQDIDPVSENVAASMGRPIYALPRQDHMAHMQTHLAFLNSPLFGGNPIIMKTFLYPMAMHLRDHLLNYYLTEAHEAVDQAQRRDLIAKEADEQVQVIIQVQQAIESQLGQFAAQLAQIDQAAQQFKPQPQMPPDNSMQVAQMNAQMQKELTAQRMQLEQSKMQQSAQLRQAEMAQKDKETQMALEKEKMDDQARLQEQQYVQDQENQRKLAELQVRERMNTADNNTAMSIVTAEIQSGEHSNLQTGTGINP